jgi:hypothetical protein
MVGKGDQRQVGIRALEPPLDLDEPAVRPAAGDVLEQRDVVVGPAVAQPVGGNA